MRPLPYPGHSWSFTQHAVGLQAKTLYDLLMCAAPFEGQVSGYNRSITDLMVVLEILTVNEREGRPDAWRDYQQILAELGLIYSTQICNALTITDLGHLFLAGDVGFSELMGLQALRYQYPNGQKGIIQSRLRGELVSFSMEVPATLIELQVNNQVLIKPGALILRILLELSKIGEAPSLTTDECQAYLIPCKSNEEWPVALDEIIKGRRTSSNISQINRHSRRNIQDWFKFLQKSDYFNGSAVSISLSDYGFTRIDMLEAYCGREEQIDSFWIPTAYDNSARLNWFTWFGSVPYRVQDLLVENPEADPTYLSSNYVAGLDEGQDEKEARLSENSTIILAPIDLEHLGRETQLNFQSDLATLAEKLKAGAHKRHAKTLLHDRIIKELAENFLAKGAIVEADSNSIDLLATWPSGASTIFEVKTVTRRSLQGRLRTAIGQVQEYSFRRLRSGQGHSDSVIVVNTEIDSNAWQKEFIVDHLHIGLIYKSQGAYKGFAANDLVTGSYWLTT